MHRYFLLCNGEIFIEKCFFDKHNTGLKLVFLVDFIHLLSSFFVQKKQICIRTDVIFLLSDHVLHIFMSVEGPSLSEVAHMIGGRTGENQQTILLYIV